MPNPFILDANPSFGSQLGQQLGQGLGAGINQGISSRLTAMLTKKKEKAGIGSAINQYAKRYEKGQFTPDVLSKIQNRASQFIDEGASKDEAALAAFAEFDNRLGEWAEGQSGTAALESLRNPSKPKKFGDDLLGSSEDNIKKFTQEKGFQDLKKLPAKAGYAYVSAYDSLRDMFSPIAAAERDLERQGYTPEEIAQSREEIQKDLPAPLRGGPPEPLTSKYLEMTGGVGPGETVLERLGQDYLVGGGLGVGMGVGREIGDATNAPEEVKLALEVAGLIGGIYSGKLKGPAKKAGQRILAYAEKKAASTGRPVGEVIADAVKESGVDLAKVSEGNAAEINKLNKRITVESPKVSEKVKAAEKTVFNPKEAIKQREAHGKKLEASPFRENFEIENRKAKIEASKTPETRAKESEVTARIQPQIDKLESRIDLQRKDLKRMEDYGNKYTGEGKGRIDANISAKKREISKLNEDLKDLRYELKNGKARPTEAQLEIDAEKAANKIVDQVRNPTPENLKSFEDQLAKDQRFLERAEATRKRGEFDKDFRADEHIRINEKYQKAYDAMVVKLKDEIQSLKGARDAESLKKIADNREAIKRLEQRQLRHKANITNQKEKIIALKSIEGPSGALYKNQIKRAQSDLAEFQKDFAQFKKVAETKAEIGTEHKGKQALKESAKDFERASKAGESVGKNPTQENISKAAEETGIRAEDIKKETGELKDILKDRAEKLKSGKANEQDVNSTTNSVNKVMSKWEARMRSTGKGLRFGFGIGVLQGVIENEFGTKIPSTYVTLGTTAFGKTERLPGRVVGAGVGRKIVNYLYDKAESSKLKDLRKEPLEYTKYVQSLRKRYSAKRVNQIIEYSK